MEISNVNDSMVSENKNQIDDMPNNIKYKKKTHLIRVSAIIGIIFSLLSWCIFLFSGHTAFIFAIIGLLTATMGSLKRSGCLRDLSITCIIACTILIFIYLLFQYGIPVIVDKI